MLREAGRLAGAACDYTTAVAAIDDLARQFAVDGDSLKLEALNSSTELAGRIRVQRLLVDAARDCAYQARQHDRYDVAEKMLKLGQLAAGELSDATPARLLADDLADLKQEQEKFEAARPAAQTLRENPDDPAANLAIGALLCFSKNRWDDGLPLLAKGSDGKLVEFARGDLAQFFDTQAYVQNGDDWWELSGTFSGGQQRNIRDRASRWYELAVPELEAGATRTRIKERVKEALAAAAAMPDSYSESLPLMVHRREFTAQNQATVKMIAGDEGFCFLSAIGGKWEGGGERLGITVGSDGHYALATQAAQPVSGRAMALLELRWRSEFGPKLQEVSWSGGKPVKLLAKEDGFCFLSQVSGKFEGEAEVGVSLAADGNWYLGGKGPVTARATVVRTLRAGALDAEIKEHAWTAGQGAVKLLPRKEGFCFLSSIGGSLEGGGEEVSVSLDKDDFWYLSGRSGQSSLRGKAMSVRFVPPRP